MIISIDDPILLRIAALAQEQGVEAYVVGGFVRDAVMGRSRTDIDITVHGDPLPFADAVAKVFSSKSVVFERFRTAMVPIGKYQVEFVGTRKESYSDDSRKPVVTSGTLEDDIRRRDFTINTLAVALNSKNMGEVIDLFNGIADIENKVLRTPLEPHVTMSDDPLRMMRAARFASQLNFKIDGETLEAITSMSDRLAIVSQERITDEFLKIMAADAPSIGLNILFDTGLLEQFLPEVQNLAGVDLVEEGSRSYAHKDVFHHTLKVVDNLAATTANVWLRLAALMHDVAKPVTKRFVQGHGWTFHGHEEVGARWQEKIFRRLKLPMQHLDYVRTMVRLHQRPMKLVDEGVTDAAIRRLAVQAGDGINDLFLLCKADVTTRNPKRAQKYVGNYDKVQAKLLDVQERDQLRAFQSPLRGEEIMTVSGLAECREVGYMKWMIEEAILDGAIPNDASAAKVYLESNLEQWKVDGKTARFGRRG